MARKSEINDLKNTKFDLAFSYMIDLCLPGVAHYLGIPQHIWIRSALFPDAAYLLNGFFIIK